MNYNFAFFAQWPVTTYAVAFLFTLACIGYTKYQFDDEKAGWRFSKGKWHPYGALQRALLFVALFLNPDWKDVFLAGSICILLFEIGVNVVALDMPPFYKGSTSTLDKGFGKYKFKAMFLLIAIAIITRILL